MRDLLLVLFLFVAIYYSFKKPYIGVAAWIWIALMAPAKWTFGFSNSFRMNLVIVVITALSYLFYKNKPKVRLSGLHFWVFLFLAWMLFSTIFHLQIDGGFVWDKLIEFSKVIVLFLFITLTVKTEKEINTIIWAIVLAISAYAGMEAVKFLMSGGGHRIVGKAGIIADRNDLAVAINMCLPLVVYLWSITKHDKLKLGLLALAALNVVAIIGTYSRGGFIGLAVLAFAMWLKSNRKFIFFMLALILLPIGYGVAPSDWKSRQSTVETAAAKDSSFIGRLWAWKIATLIALDNPLTGGGFKATNDPMLWRLYANETPNFAYDTPPIPPTQHSLVAHNIYFQVIASAGFAGFYIFMHMLLLAYLVCKQNIKKSRKTGDKAMLNLSKAISLSCIGYAITGMNVSLAYFELVYILIGLIIVINHRVTEQFSLQKPVY